MRTIVTAALCASILAGCASSPDKISAAYVSPIQYSNYDCDQVRSELMRVSSKVREVAGAQQKQANNDAIAMGVALVVFWPALFFIGGNDRKEELSRLKGEYDALEQAAIQKSCPVAAELKAGRGG